MALIGTLRNRMGKIVVGAIMLTMLSFILTDLIGNSTLLGGQADNPDIAEMAGEAITNENFQAKVNLLSYTYSLNTGRNPDQNELIQIRDQAWNALILESAYQNQFDELGIGFTQKELDDMIIGNNISPEIQSFFTDPQTGLFSKEAVTNFIASVSQAPPQQQASWTQFVRSIEPSRLAGKYQNLLSKTNYVTKYEAKESYEGQNSNASIEYLFVPYLSVSDSLVTTTDSELEKYIEENKEEFEREESRNIEYVVFDIFPSSQDSVFVKDEVNETFAQLAAATNDSSFVAINSDDPYSFLTYQSGNIPAALKDGDEVRETGFVSDPTIINGSYEFYKLSRKDEITSDSVLFRVAKIKKEFFVSDETVNEVYRNASLFAASVEDTESFGSYATEQGYQIQKGNNLDRNATRLGSLNEARSIILWVYNEAEEGDVSDVLELGDKYIVATLNDIQEKGLANLQSVRNQVTRKVQNDKKGDIIVQQLNEIAGSELSEIASSFGENAKTGTTDVQLFSNNISSVGYAPEAIGLSFALDEEENTKAFKVQDGVIMMKLVSKTTPESQQDYSPYVQQVAQKREGFRTVIADFPLTYFRVYVSRNVDDAIKEFADIEDMRYKFF